MLVIYIWMGRDREVGMFLTVSFYHWGSFRPSLLLGTLDACQLLFMVFHHVLYESHSVMSDCDPMGFTVHGILQARILEWIAVPFSRGSSQPRD